MLMADDTRDQLLVTSVGKRPDQPRQQVINDRHNPRPTGDPRALLITAFD